VKLQVGDANVSVIEDNGDGVKVAEFYDFLVENIQHESFQATSYSAPQIIAWLGALYSNFQSRSIPSTPSEDSSHSSTAITSSASSASYATHMPSVPGWSTSQNPAQVPAPIALIQDQGSSNLFSMNQQTTGFENMSNGFNQPNPGSQQMQFQPNPLSFNQNQTGFGRVEPPPWSMQPTAPQAQNEQQMQIEQESQVEQQRKRFKPDNSRRRF
jgi:hypothetical protein